MSGFEVQVVARPRELGAGARVYARQKIAHLARYAPRPVLFARIKLERMADPAVERPAVAEATLEVSGHLLRAHAAAGRLEEAVDLLEDRLRQQLEHLSSHLHTRQHGRS
jgi:ribosome-associated translation inhibitor RaiA